jgi:NADH dehydrogenase FAD-containing subunit
VESTFVIAEPRDDRASAPVSKPKQVVLLGAGHAHLDVIRFARSFTRRGFALTVVAPGAFWYSGLATGMLGGTYAPEEDQVDVFGLVQQRGGRFVPACVQEIDPKTRTVILSSGPELHYDVVSLSLGSEVPTWTVPGLTERAIAVKPIKNLVRLHDEVTSRLKEATTDRPVRIAVVGGGATACEIAGNLCGLVERSSGRAEVILIAGGDRLMESWTEEAAAVASDSLIRRGVSILLRSPGIRVEEGFVTISNGVGIPFDVLVAATGLVPHRLIRATGLPTDEQGGLLVDQHLRSIADPNVFGGGDCIALEGHDLARVGVHGVRQAPILRHNLLAALDGRPPWAYRSFRPQNQVLQILNLGDGTGLAARGRWHWHGPLALKLKDWIDRRFLATYQ